MKLKKFLNIGLKANVVIVSSLAHKTKTCNRESPGSLKIFSSIFLSKSCTSFVHCPMVLLHRALVLVISSAILAIFLAFIVSHTWSSFAQDSGCFIALS